jgi:glyoxylase-like metal-dependent hydrolase (beta-lactamase superfamily II)
MPSVRLDVISIGTLSRNRLWGETQGVRTAHATTSLIRSGKRNILIDPGLPAPAIVARLFERAGMRAEQIDTVFLTNFRPSHRAGLAAFLKAKVLIHEREQGVVAEFLRQVIEQAPPEDVDRAQLAAELKLLESATPAPDKLADNVDLFPLPGYTPGTCGLLIAAATQTTLIAGDAVPTLDHFLAGQVLPDSWDINAAGESMREVYEIADLIVPGHDNLFANPRAAGF